VYPILFSIGPLHFYSYGLCLGIALAVSIYLFANDAKRNLSKLVHLKPEMTFQKVFDLAVWVIIFSLLGARLFYVLENHWQFEGPFVFGYFDWHLLPFIQPKIPILGLLSGAHIVLPLWGPWWDAFAIWEGGLVYYGGLFGAVLAALFWFRMEKWPMAYSFDLVAPYILLGQAIGRVGCFLNGCCYGNVNYHYGMVFQGEGDGLPHLPTQLWELAGDLVLFFLLIWTRRWTIRYPWMSLSLYGFTYGILRFVIEFWRRDWDKRYLVFFNSASQAVSGILIVVSLAVILWTLYSNRPKTGRANAK
jgi:phosphatidylglycerol---prolipoprotein diacylglyceryl transferase